VTAISRSVAYNLGDLFDMKVATKYKAPMLDQKRERARRHKDKVSPVGLLSPINLANIMFPPS
jgi:hypothetical protein